MRLQPIYNIAEICAKKGVKEAVLCPGSRCAPLTLAFVRHPAIATRTISDERSAGFIALGSTLETSQPVVVVCTSGTAAYNLAPAVAEAYFQHRPLIVITADRPKEWIDQLDGQTMFQTNLYGNHVKKFFELPEDYEHADAKWFINRTVNEAINLSMQEPPGPVHINVPLREPLYPLAGEEIVFDSSARIMDQVFPDFHLSEELFRKYSDRLKSFNRVLLVAGQNDSINKSADIFQKFSNDHHIPVITDIISNLHEVNSGIKHADVLLGNCTSEIKKALQPQLLISFGKSIISKNVKTFLRQFKPVEHWHIQANGSCADTFQSLTECIHADPISFFQGLTGNEKINPERKKYYQRWIKEEHNVNDVIHSFFKEKSATEFHIVAELLKNLPEGSNLHLANSMPVRYANFIGLAGSGRNIKIYCNRGTSGIDGCTSTAVGHALTTNNPVVLITGDMAFFYDRNAFWHNYKLPNLRIVVLNNQGGTIFSMIDGPGSLPESDEYFVTKQNLKAKSLADEFGFNYLTLKSAEQMPGVFDEFFKFDGKTKVLEIHTDKSVVKKTMDQFKSEIRKNYEP